MAEGEKFASVLVSDLLRSNEETLRLRARIAELEACLKDLMCHPDLSNCAQDDIVLLLKKGEANDGG